VAWQILLQNISTRGRLLQELGSWVNPTHQQWQWYYDASQDVVYHMVELDQWVKYTPAPPSRVTQRSTKVYSSPIDGNFPLSPQFLCPTTVTIVSETSIQSIPSFFPLAEQIPEEESSVWSPNQIPPELADTPTFYQHIIGPTPPTAFQCTELATTLQEDIELLECSDGSYVEETGDSYHGWILASDKRKTIAEGSGPGHGHPDLLSSYRSELCGILAILYIVQRVCHSHRITSGTLHMYCDNKSALLKTVTTGPRGISPFFSADYDLITLIRLQTTLLSISVVGEWVKGHFTGERREYKHDLNDCADRLAANAARIMPPPFLTRSTVDGPPGYRVRLSNRRGIIHSKYYQMLAQAHHSQPLVDYILRKTGWSKSTFNRVDWDSHHRAFRRLTRFQRISTTKLVHNLMNTNRQNNLFYGMSNSCPGCNNHEETLEHVLRCSYGPTVVVRQDGLKQLENRLKTMGTPPPVIKVIMEGFSDWMDPQFPAARRSRPSTFGSLNPTDILLTQAYSDQYHTIGWFQFCLGRVSKLWHRAVQAQLPKSQPYRPNQWGSNLVSALWIFTKGLWHHRNTIVHGASAEETAQRILSGLRDQVLQHYTRFNADNSYVLARHRYLFQSRTQYQRLSMSYDSLKCWLRSVDEAQELQASHIASQQANATLFFDLPTSSSVQTSDTSDTEYIAPSAQGSDTTSIVTNLTHPSTRTGSSASTLLDTTNAWGFSSDDENISNASIDTTSSLLAPTSFCSRVPLPPRM